GRPRKLNSIDEQYISSLIDHRPTIYLDEIQDALLSARWIHVSIPTLFRALQRLGLTRKVVDARAFERDEAMRHHYLLEIARIAPRPDMLVFIDETARNQRTSQRKYGRA
ncbi:hypothetical protein BDP27DRAFT_1176385, partial [Rhodocollybia butyracea]